MTKRKLTLGLAGALVAVSGMAACNEVTYRDGVILTYTDSSGKIVTDFRAQDLFEDYLPTSASASTVFKTVREVLIRNYFEQPAQANRLELAKTEANKAVSALRETAKNNADSNKTTYQVEWEKLLNSNNVENVDELFEAKLLEEEKKLFDDEYYTTASYNALRDGKRWTVDNPPESIKLDTPELVEKYGPVSKGYLTERLPYHVSHILVKLSSASNNEHTQDKISENEARNLSAVVKEIAGVNNDEAGTNVAINRLRFGSIAKEISEDDTSAENYGDLGIMDKSTSFVPEFKLGVYAYEALYNLKTNSDPVAEELLPSDEDESIDADAIVQAFKDRKIGTIPYGAFVALGKDAVAKNPDLGYRVNDNSELFYPRNVLFNKYMNSHQIAVITPNEIPFNMTAGDRNAAWDGTNFADVFAEETENGNPKTAGAASAAYAALPGFQTNTTGIVNVGGGNVLTNEKGQIILAVRAGTSSYQGIHFIVVDRSPLTQFAKYDEDTGAHVEISEDEYNEKKRTEDVTSLSEYYTMEAPKNVPSNDHAAATNADSYYPFYKEAGASTYYAKNTFVNKLATTEADYDASAKKVREAIKGVVTDDGTYIFEELMVSGNIKFNTESTFGAKLEKLVTTYIKNSRTTSPIDTMESFDKDWKNYMEYLDEQDVERQMNATGSQELISEVCAIGYGSADAKHGTGYWAKGGACYDGK